MKKNGHTVLLIFIAVTAIAIGLVYFGPSSKGIGGGGTGASIYNFFVTSTSVQPLSTITVQFDALTTGTVNISVQVDSGAPQTAQNYHITQGFHYLNNFNYNNISPGAHNVIATVTDSGNGATLASKTMQLSF